MSTRLGTSDRQLPGNADRRTWLGLAVLTLPVFLVSMDVSVLYLAIPSISALPRSSLRRVRCPRQHPASGPGASRSSGEPSPVRSRRSVGPGPRPPAVRRARP